MKFKLQFMTVLFICLFSATCFSANVANLTNQTNIEGVSRWQNKIEFYYFDEKREWFIYNIQTNKYRKALPPASDWIVDNSSVRAKFVNDNGLLQIQNKTDGSIKEVQLTEDFATYFAYASGNGKYIGLCIMGTMEDTYKWVILNVKTLKLSIVPMEQNEYSWSTIAWSNDSRYIAVDIIRVKDIDDVEADISHSGLLIFDVENGKVVRKILNSSFSYWFVKGFMYPEVLYLNEKDQLCIYNVNSNKFRLICEYKLDNALWGPNKEVYTVLNGKLVKILY